MQSKSSAYQFLPMTVLVVTGGLPTHAAFMTSNSGWGTFFLQRKNIIPFWTVA
jgi:hypothetical protein